MHAVLIHVVERTEGVPIAQAARFDDLCADIAITQMNHQQVRRNVEEFSSIFSTDLHPLDSTTEPVLQLYIGLQELRNASGAKPFRDFLRAALAGPRS